MAGTYSKLLFHIVFSTKDRRHLIRPEFEDELYRYLGGVLRNQNAVLLDAGGMPDHVHLLVKLIPSHRLSDLMRDMKANSSAWMSERVPGFSWQDGYAVFSVSESQYETVANYIRGQKEHHRQRDFRAELEAIFSRHGVVFDRKLLWK